MVDEDKETQIKFGVSVSKRNFKTAVMRNRIKRQIREAYRLNKYLLLDKISNLNISLPFMLIYIGREPIESSEIELKVKQILIRLGEKIAKEKE